MKLITILVIVVIVGSLGLGTALGLFIKTAQDSDQVYTFSASAIQTPTPIQCGTIPRNFTKWFEINVIGNRTEMSFQSVTVFDTGQQSSSFLPLNQTALAEYKATNSTFESIIVPLPSFFDTGDVLSASMSYSLNSFAPETQTLTGIPIIEQQLVC
ncbi:MAG: hypothetical protein OK439_02990 [Thaumarchaeota archaeon]|nr:hypothetical protein [Nitrososphaerota archaeon]